MTKCRRWPRTLRVRFLCAASLAVFVVGLLDLGKYVYRGISTKVFPREVGAGISPDTNDVKSLRHFTKRDNWYQTPSHIAVPSALPFPCKLKGWWENFIDVNQGRGYDNKMQRIQANALIAKQLHCFFKGAGPAFGVVRPGIVEMKLLPLYNNQTIHEGLLHQASSNAGVTPPTEAQGRLFIKEYVNSMKLASRDGGLVAIFGVPTEEAFVKELAPDSLCIHNRALEPFYAGRSFGHSDKPWSVEIKSRTLLVVHPFAVSIQRQYFKHVNGEPLFSDPDVLPQLKALKTVPAITSFAGASTQYNWSLNLEIMKAQIAAQAPFDLAILGCGGYGQPLTSFIVTELHKPAIYIGGGTQLLFGIRGERWESHEDLRNLIRSSWVGPLQSEIPPNAANIEDSAYWSTAGNRDESLPPMMTSKLHLARHGERLIDALKVLGDSQYDGDEPTLSIHLDRTYMRDENLRRNAHDFVFKHGPKMVNTWPQHDNLQMCAHVYSPEENELTIIIEDATSFSNDWYKLVKQRWMTEKDSVATAAILFGANRHTLGAFAFMSKYWVDFREYMSKMDEEPGNIKGELDVGLGQCDITPCLCYFMTFCSQQNLTAVRVM